MTLSCEEQLRRDLLLKALEVFRDTELAMDATLQMERFVRGGERASLVPFRTSACSSIAKSDAHLHPVAAETDPPASSETAKRRRWTESDDVLLRRFWSEGLTARAISERLQRSEASVATRASVLKLKRTADRPLIRSPHETRNGTGARGTEIPALAARVAKTAGGRPVEAAPSRSKDGGKGTEGGAASDERLNSPEGPIETVIRFLRSRDYSVVRTDKGRFRLDEREDLTSQELLSRANKVRAYLRQPPFPALAS